MEILAFIYILIAIGADNPLWPISLGKLLLLRAPEESVDPGMAEFIKQHVPRRRRRWLGA